MPHAELHYSDDLTIDAGAMLARIEAVLGEHDAGAGVCKGRAYPVAIYHHTHFLAKVSLLRKAHRDAAFMSTLAADLETAIKALISQPCYFSLELAFSSDSYITNQHDGSS